MPAFAPRSLLTAAVVATVSLGAGSALALAEPNSAKDTQPTSAPNVTAEDGLATVGPKGTILANGSVRVKITCFEGPAKVACTGTVTLRVDGKDWTLVQGDVVDEVAAGETASVTLKPTTQGRKYLKKRCSVKTQATFSNEDFEDAQLADLDQRPVQLKRKSKNC